MWRQPHQGLWGETSPPEVSDQEMTRLHDQGVRGLRYILAHPGGLDTATLERSADRARSQRIQLYAI